MIVGNAIVEAAEKILRGLLCGFDGLLV